MNPEKDEINFGEDPMRKVPNQRIVSPEEVAVENAKEVYELGELRRKIIKSFQLAKSAEDGVTMEKHLKEFYMLLMDMLEPSKSHFLKENAKDDRETLVFLKSLVDSKYKRLEWLGSNFLSLGQGTNGQRIYFETEVKHGQEQGKDGNPRWMVYHMPSKGESWNVGRDYWNRFITCFGTDTVDLLGDLEVKEEK